jgi:hypothetical protein
MINMTRFTIKFTTDMLNICTIYPITVEAFMITTTHSFQMMSVAGIIDEKPFAIVT